MLASPRAHAKTPTVLLLDEPSEGLAPSSSNRSARSCEVARDRTPLLLVEQNLGLATQVRQRVLVMNKGTIVFTGTPAELAANRDVETRYLGV